MSLHPTFLSSLPTLPIFASVVSWFPLSVAVKLRRYFLKVVRLFTSRCGGTVRYLRSTQAVAAFEYAILVGVVAAALVGGLTAFSDQLTAAINVIGDTLGPTAASIGTP